MSARFGSVYGRARVVATPSYEQFTDDQRTALISAERMAEDEERSLRMDQTEAFCLGQDGIAERYDVHVAKSARTRRTLNELTDIAYGIPS